MPSFEKDSRVSPAEVPFTVDLDDMEGSPGEHVEHAEVPRAQTVSPPAAFTPTRIPGNGGIVEIVQDDTGQPFYRMMPGASLKMQLTKNPNGGKPHIIASGDLDEVALHAQAHQIADQIHKGELPPNILNPGAPQTPDYFYGGPRIPGMPLPYPYGLLPQPEPAIPPWLAAQLQSLASQGYDTANGQTSVPPDTLTSDTAPEDKSILGDLGGVREENPASPGFLGRRRAAKSAATLGALATGTSAPPTLTKERVKPDKPISKSASTESLQKAGGFFASGGTRLVTYALVFTLLADVSENVAVNVAEAAHKMGGNPLNWKSNISNYHPHFDKNPLAGPLGVLWH